MIVILAGYPDRMAAVFAKNAGLKSRFTESLQFEDWTSEQLSELVVANLKKSTPGYAFDDEAAVKRELSSGFDRIRVNDATSWANARDGNTMRDFIMDVYDERAAAFRQAIRDPDAFAPPITGAVRSAAFYCIFCVAVLTWLL